MSDDFLNKLTSVIALSISSQLTVVVTNNGDVVFGDQHNLDCRRVARAVEIFFERNEKFAAGTVASLLDKLEGLKVLHTNHIPDKRNNALLDRCIALVREDMGDASTRKDEEVEAPARTSPATDTLNLLPCPFCGGQAKLNTETEHGGWECNSVSCSECGAAVDSYSVDDRRSYDQFLPPEQSKQDAANNWNARPSEIPVKSKQVEFEVIDSRAGMLGRDKRCPKNFTECIPAREAGEIWLTEDEKRLAEIHIPAALEMMFKLWPLPENEENSDADLVWTALSEAKEALERRPKREANEISGDAGQKISAILNGPDPVPNARELKREIVLPNDLSIKISGIVDDHATEPNLYTLSEATKDILTLIETAGLARESGKLDFLDEPKTRGAIQEALTKYFSAADKAYGEHIGASADVIEAIRNSIEGQSS